MIAIVDYGMGNLGSVAKACRFLGARVRVTDSRAAIRRADGVIFPGVGAFGPAMRELARRGLVEPIQRGIRDGKPFLGLCLGLQLLFEGSDESPGVRGLGILRGRVRKLPVRRGLKVPHMGWNQIEKCRDASFGDTSSRVKCPFMKRPLLLRGVPDGAFMYFVHSFYADPGDPAVVAARTRYGVPFASVVWNGENLWATQFHPEKSQRWGLQILKNFIRECAC